MKGAQAAQVAAQGAARGVVGISAVLAGEGVRASYSNDGGDHA